MKATFSYLVTDVLNIEHQRQNRKIEEGDSVKKPQKGLINFRLYHIKVISICRELNRAW